MEIMSDFVIPSTEFCREQFVARGMIVDLAVHDRIADCQSKPDRPCAFSERTRGTVDEKWQRISLEKA